MNKYKLLKNIPIKILVSCQGRHPHINKCIMRFLLQGELLLWVHQDFLAEAEDIKCNPLMTVRPGLAHILL